MDLATIESFSSIHFVIGVIVVIEIFSFMFHSFQSLKSEQDNILDVECFPSDFNLKVKNKLITEVGEYKSPWWYSSHLATMVPFGYNHRLKYERETLEDKVGGVFALDWYPRKPIKEKNNKVCVFLPCLGGTSNDKFVQNYAVELWSQSYYTVIVTPRGLQTPLRNSVAWHPGFALDALSTIQHVYEFCGDTTQIFMTGFSAGTSIIFNTLKINQESRAPVPVVGACVVCVVGSYVKVRDNLQNSFMGRLYSYLMAMKHKDIIRQNKEVFSAEVVSTLLGCSNLGQFDTAAMKSIYNFESEEALDEAFSCRIIGELKIPIIAIQPRDDPLHQGLAKQNNQVSVLVKNTQLIYVEPARGSHIGFYEGGLSNAFGNKTCYTYPAVCSLVFFNALLEDSGSCVSTSHEQEPKYTMDSG